MGASAGIHSTTLRSARYDILKHRHYTIYFLQRPPKLVNVKYASRLQTVSKRYRGGGEVLPIKGHHREPAAGKRTYHYALIGEAARGISRSHIGNSSAGPLTQSPYFGANFTRNPSGGCFDFAQHDMFLCGSNSFISFNSGCTTRARRPTQSFWERVRENPFCLKRVFP